MMAPSRRAWLQALLALGAGGALASAWAGKPVALLLASADDTGAAVQTGSDEGRVIAIEAKRFRFTPDKIVVQRGEVVTLALRALDFAHGFSLPDFGVRIDLVPGKVVKLRLQAKQAGQFDFLCDNFCGDFHEEMSGTLIVQE